MREIKFKVWDEVDKKWVSKFFIQIDNDGERTVLLPRIYIPPTVTKGGVRDGEVVNEGSIILPFLDPDKCKIVQYIGIKDNTKWEQLTPEEQKVWLDSGKTKDEWNGKEIYEGNVLGSIGAEEIEIDGIVKWMDDRGAYYLVDKDGYVTDSDYCYDGEEWKNLEIVADIHENPEVMTDYK